MTTKLLRQLILFGIAPFLIASAGVASAQQTTPSTDTDNKMSMTNEQIKDHYEATMKRCGTLKGNEKDLCEKQAKAERNAAEVDANAEKKKVGTEQNAPKENRDDTYDTAKEKCEAISGDAKNKCITEAKTKHEK